MGEPNDHQSSTIEEVLRALLCEPGSKVNESTAHALGLDLQVAEATFMTEVKPRLDMLSGYKPLTELNPEIPIHLEDWVRLVQMSGLEKYGQAQLVVRTRLHGNHWGDFSEVKPGNKAVAIYLAREGTWLLWHGVHGPYLRVLRQHLIEYSDLASLCEAVTVVAEELTFTETGKSDPPIFAPLLIERGLRLLLERTLSERERRVADMRIRLDRAQQRVARIDVGR
jgi:hypothetical protein